jgi:hypothetical protein
MRNSAEAVKTREGLVEQIGSFDDGIQRLRESP